jgi:thioester reductase-like protein
VVGTANVVKFALAHRVKRLHYASTLSVFVGSDQNRGMAFEDDDLTKTSFLYGGYAQSKWAAEVLLRAVDGSSMPLDIYRFGLLTGDSETSEFPRHDLFAMTVRGLLMLRCVPVGETELEVDVTPVDFAARAMVEIARQQMLQRHRSGDAVSTWHIANPESLKSGRLFDVIADCGTDIDRVGSTEFIGRAREQSGTNQAAACLSLCRWLSETGQCDVIRPLDLFQATEIQFEMTRTLRALSAAGIHCPPPSRQLIRRYITHILRTE